MTDEAIQPARWQSSTIIAVRKLTPRVSSFSFRPSEPFSYLAGQHADVRLTAPDGYSAQRSYSIASAPGSGETVELAIEKLEDGEVSPFFHEVAAVGDEIELRGPLGGHFIWREQDGGPVMLVGGGSGVVPLMSMVRQRAAAGSSAPMALLYSARTWDEVIFREELIELAERKDGLHLAFAITREGARRGADFGRRIDAEMIKAVLALLPAAPIRTYACGANAFVSTAAEALIGAGMAAVDIRTERYGG